MASPLFKCTNPGCNARNSRNLLKGSNGHCPHCKTAMTHDSWIGGTYTVQQMIRLHPDDDKELRELAKSAGMTVPELVLAAVSSRLRYWLEDRTEADKRIKQDLVLTKLYKR